MGNYVLVSFVDRKAVIRYKDKQDIIIESVAKVQFVTNRYRGGTLKGYAIETFIRFVREDGSTAQYPSTKMNLSETESFLKERNIDYENVDNPI